MGDFKTALTKLPMASRDRELPGAALAKVAMMKVEMTEKCILSNLCVFKMSWEESNELKMLQVFLS